MDFARAFSFVFEDKDWLTKILIGAVVLLIPLVGIIIVFGWGLEVTRRVIAGEQPELPDWSNFGTYVGNGFKALVVILVYGLPLFILALCNMGVTMMTDPRVVGIQTAKTMETVAALVGVVVGCLDIIYGLFLALVMPAAFGNMMATGELGAAFRFGEVFRLSFGNLGIYILVLVGEILANLISGLGSIACFVGVFFTLAYSYAVIGHLAGQAYRAAKGLDVQEATL